MYAGNKEGKKTIFRNIEKCTDLLHVPYCYVERQVAEHCDEYHDNCMKIRRNYMYIHTCNMFKISWKGI